MNRPINLDLLTIRYPFTAIVSLLHRLSGIFVFLLIPFLLWLLGTVLDSAKGFSHFHTLMSSFFIKIFVWLFLIALWYHLLAGIRHLVMDIGWGEHLGPARTSGVVILILTLLGAILLGGWLLW